MPDGSDPDLWNAAIRNVLRRCRGQMTLEAAGDLIGMDRNHVWKLENEKFRVPGTRTLRRVADGYQMVLAELMALFEIEFAALSGVPPDPKLGRMLEAANPKKKRTRGK